MASTLPVRRDTLYVSEIFGPTLQGEGPNAGKQATFLRLGGCNLTCSWCDTKYTWDKSQYNLRETITPMPVDNVVAVLHKHHAPYLVVTGGEPLLQQPALWPVLYGVRDEYQRIDIETNGTVPPGQMVSAVVDCFNISPKLRNSGNDAHKVSPAAAISAIEAQERWAVGRFGRQRYILKFVCRSFEDILEIRALVEQLGIDGDRIWIMPEATTLDELNQRQGLATYALREGWNWTDRLHIRLWGNTRGH